MESLQRLDETLKEEMRHTALGFVKTWIWNSFLIKDLLTEYQEEGLGLSSEQQLC